MKTHFDDLFFSFTQRQEDPEVKQPCTLHPQQWPGALDIKVIDSRTAESHKITQKLIH